MPKKNLSLTRKEIYRRLDRQEDKLKLKRSGEEIPLSIIRAVDGYSPETEHLIMLDRDEYHGIPKTVKRAFLFTDQDDLDEAKTPNLVVKVYRYEAAKTNEIIANRKRGFLYATQERNSKLYLFMFMLGHVSYENLCRSTRVTIDEKLTVFIQGLLEIDMCTFLNIAQNDSNCENVRQDLKTKKTYLIDYDIATDLSKGGEVRRNYLSHVKSLKWLCPQLFDYLAEELQIFIKSLDAITDTGPKVASDCLTLFKSHYPSHYDEACRRQLLENETTTKASDRQSIR